MKIGKYETNILGALKDRVFGTKYPKRGWYYPTDNWITDEKEVERIIRERGMEL